MRYYRLTIAQASGGGSPLVITSHPNGPQQPPDAGALQVEYNVKVSPFATPAQDASGGGASGSLIRIWGVPIALLSQAHNFNAPGSGAPLYTATLQGGMGKGLPLANPAQIGTLIQGSIWRAIGNWVGVDMTLDLYLTSPVGGVSQLPYTKYAADKTPNLPVNNFSIHWVAGQPMGPAIQAALQAAYPNTTVTVSVSPQLIVPTTEDGYYHSMAAFASEVKSRSLSILGPNDPGYYGVEIKATNGIVAAYDYTQQGEGTTPVATVGGPSKVIAPTDLIGQPTWIANGQISVSVVQRGDIDIGNRLTLPATLSTAGSGVVAQGALVQNFPLAFSGNWIVNKLTHIGNYKSPQAQQWMTVFECFNPTQPMTLPTSPPATSAPPKTPAPLASAPPSSAGPSTLVHKPSKDTPPPLMFYPAPGQGS